MITLSVITLSVLRSQFDNFNDFQFYRSLRGTAPDHADHGVLLEGRSAGHPRERRHQVGHDVRGQLDPRLGNHF